MTHTLCWGLLALPLNAIYTALALLPLVLIKSPTVRLTAICGLLLIFSFSTMAFPATTPYALSQRWPLYAISGCLIMLAGVCRHLPSLSCSIVTWLTFTTLDPLTTPLATTLPALPLETLSGQSVTLSSRTLTPRLLLLWRSDDASSTQQLALLTQCRHSLAPLALVAVNQGDSLLAVLAAVDTSAPPSGTDTKADCNASTPPVSQLRDRNQRLATALSVRHLPLLVLINRRGHVVAASVETLNCKGLRRLIDNHRDIFEDDDMS